MLISREIEEEFFGKKQQKNGVMQVCVYKRHYDLLCAVEFATSWLQNFFYFPSSPLDYKRIDIIVCQYAASVSCES